MYEVKERHLKVGRHTVTVYQREVIDHNVLTVFAGTNAGELDPAAEKWDTKTVFGIRDDGCTNWIIESDGKGFSATLEGVAELETVIKALRFILKVLEDERDEVHD